MARVVARRRAPAYWSGTASCSAQRGIADLEHRVLGRHQRRARAGDAVQMLQEVRVGGEDL
ncbi:MAG TPA: hypothetical protein VGL60_01385 [Acidimicrobiales bacterium]